uniref:Tyrosine-protein kinase ephrin type A/B receptor-like domain-containing protein n=1 Tax=Hemiselmis andersenii TaxID=464988 RepID=A0A6U4TQQ1_HEMAN|mmetsp:Transcript_20189/g.48744  ORF Transcript_20189/g.48744 Transcript_20189/m.48744 type:complete len:620 (+) Transcript_20189:106-1965(+)
MHSCRACKQKKSSSVSAGQSDAVRCGVCFAMVDEILYELKKTENSTSTLDMRWGLTSEVKDGRAKRIGKVIPYKRSELRSIEVMEGLCEQMKNYGTDSSMPGETKLGRSNKRPDEPRDVKQFNRLKIDADDQKRFERYCEELIDGREDIVISSIRDAHDSVEMEDALCFGPKGFPCGASRSLCPVGSFGGRNGTMPCELCPQGTFAAKAGLSECVNCPQHYNTTDTGTNSTKGCVPLCKPGHFGGSTNGLAGIEPCHKCGHGLYQEEYGSIMCDKCPDGKGTKKEGSAHFKDCISICGDGKQSTEEECDDGNTSGGDGCDRKCKIEKSFSCQGGVTSKSSCNKVVCGDGKIQSSYDGKIVEECDEGNSEAGDGCSAECAVEAGYQCALNPETGVSACMKVTCGDGVRGASHDRTVIEGCDDGNAESGDGCSENCQPEVGFTCKGEIRGKYECHKVGCGDGLKERSGTVIEQCDDGNTDDGDGCDSRCREEEGWQCSDGSAQRNVVGPPGFHSHEKSFCEKLPACGDGRRDKPQGETCDDGNTSDGDGCSSTCTVEPGYGCWADRNGEEGKPPPGPDDIVPDTCKKMSGKKRGRDGRIVEEEDDDDGTGRSRKAVHRVDL